MNIDKKLKRIALKKFLKKNNIFVRLCYYLWMLNIKYEKWHSVFTNKDSYIIHYKLNPFNPFTYIMLIILTIIGLFEVLFNDVIKESIDLLFKYHEA